MREMQFPVTVPGLELAASLNRLAAAEALITEMREALEASAPWIATALVGREDAHPQAVANHEADKAAAFAAILKAKAWEASRAD